MLVKSNSRLQEVCKDMDTINNTDKDITSLA